MGDVIERDFGKDDRERARKLAHLLKLLDERDADLLANPGKYFQMASQKIEQQQLFIRALQEVLWNRTPLAPPTPEFMPPPRLDMDVMNIDRRDYEAFQKLRALIDDYEL